MSRLNGRLNSILRRGHIDDARLDALAGAGIDLGAAATSAEQAHLRDCRRCRSLLVGFRRSAAVLSGEWVDRPLNRGVAVPTAAGRVRLGPVAAVGRNAAGGAGRRKAVPAAMIAVLVAVVATAGLLTLRGEAGLRPAASVSGASGSAASGSAQSPGGATPYGTPGRTGLVTRLPLGGQVSWAPDSQHLLVASQAQSIVYDRFGNSVATFGQVEGWLDATHLVSGDGRVAAIDEPYTGAPQDNSWVVASGHGAAAIVVAVPGCVGDPEIEWYRDGHLDTAREEATPFGWSTDGKLVLLGHHNCADSSAPADNWKGSVDVVDFASGRVLASAPNVRGDMAFNPSATLLAAQSDANLEIVTIAGGAVRTIAGARFLGWFDDDHLYYMANSTLEMLNLRAGASASAPVGSGEWQVPSSSGTWLVVDAAGAARRIATADGTTTLLDLSSAGLLVPEGEASVQAPSALQQPLWSPDGRMLALAARDATFLALFSVTDLPGSIEGALPTPIASPQAVAELDRSALPGRVVRLVSDPARNAFWFLGGVSGGPITLYRYDVATAALSSDPIAGTTYDETRDRLAIAPTGKLWIGAGYDLIEFDPEGRGQTSLTMPSFGPDVQVDPAAGKADPWISGIAFDTNGAALVARNWVRSVARVSASLEVKGSVDVSDGFAMTGGVVVAGGRVFVLADPASGLCLGVDATGSGTLSNLKFEAPGIAAVGNRVLLAGTPPGWIDAQGGAAMIEPVLATADLVAAGPDGTAVLYDRAYGLMQWRDAAGKVSAQGVFNSGAAPIVALGYDGQGRQWAVESAGGAYSLVRLSLG